VYINGVIKYYYPVGILDLNTKNTSTRCINDKVFNDEQGINDQWY